MPCDTSPPHPIGSYYHRSALTEQAKTVKNIPRISSPIDHVPVHIACFDAPCVQCLRLLSVICVIDQA